MDCKHKGCGEAALIFAEFCWDHLTGKEDYKKTLEDAVINKKGLAGCNLKKAVLAGASIEKASLAGANLSQANLSGAIMFDSNMEGAEMIGADLTGCDLTHCNLKRADMIKATLAGARLWNADLTGANLTECDMSGADLWSARLFDVKLWRTIFAGARSITQKNFSADFRFLGESRINESGELSAEESYRDLKQYFISNGMYNDASWASFKEKTMERRGLKKKKSPAYIPSLIISGICGYGEKPARIVCSALATILAFAALYAMLGAVECAGSPAYPLRWIDYIYFSTITYTTVGFGDFLPKAGATFRMLAAFEAFLGVFLSGLFIITFARRYSAR